MKLPAEGRPPSGEPAGVPARLRIGRVAGSHGLEGALRVRLDNPDSTTLAEVAWVLLETAGAVREYRVRQARPLNHGMHRVVLEGIGDANLAAALKGANVMVATADLPPARPGEFYYFEAIGCEVFTLEGKRVGVVEEIFATGANDVWVVRDGAAEVLVPVIENVVKTMDLRRRRMVIEAVPGLLDE